MNSDEKCFLFNPFKKRYRDVRRELAYLKLNVRHRKELQRIRRKIHQNKKIKVAFLLVNESIWKYSRLYFLLQNDSRFEPVVFICPFERYGSEIMKQEMNNAYSQFVQKGYQVKKTLQSDGHFLDIKKEFNPDLVFFCTPWQHTQNQYTISNFTDRLTCYTHYGFSNGNLYRYDYNLPTQNLAWKFFLESDAHQKLAVTYASRKGRNTVVTGYPGTDDLIDPDYNAKDPWRYQNTFKKRIIWAPHHTIPGNISEKNYLNYSTFLDYSDFMIEIATQYQQEVQFAFKPHPNLKGKLNEHWGEEKTAAYYKKWNEMPNTQLEEGDYTDLFLTSDALVHDCSSFLIEYFFTHNPVLYLVRSEDYKTEYSPFGIKALEAVPLGKSEKDITSFIEEILSGNDSSKEKRSRFYEQYLRTPGNKSASENMYECLLNKFKMNRRN